MSPLLRLLPLLLIAVSLAAGTEVLTCASVRTLYKQHNCCNAPDKSTKAVAEMSDVALPNPHDPDGIANWWPQLLSPGRGDPVPENIQGRYVRGDDCGRYIDLYNNRVLDQGDAQSGIIYYDDANGELFIKHVFNHVHEVEMYYDRIEESRNLTGHEGPTATCPMRLQRFAFDLTDPSAPEFKYDKAYTNCEPNPSWDQVAHRAAMIFNTWNTSYPKFQGVEEPKFEYFLAAYPYHTQMQGVSPENRLLFYQLTLMPWYPTYKKCGPAGLTCGNVNGEDCTAENQPPMWSWNGPSAWKED